jgi:hypothetical protein
MLVDAISKFGQHGVNLCKLAVATEIMLDATDECKKGLHERFDTLWSNRDTISENSRNKKVLKLLRQNSERGFIRGAYKFMSFFEAIKNEAQKIVADEPKMLKRISLYNWDMAPFKQVKSLLKSQNISRLSSQSESFKASLLSSLGSVASDLTKINGIITLQRPPFKIAADE